MTMWDQLSAEEMAWKRDCAQFATEQLQPRHGVHDRENTFPADIHEAAHNAGLMNIGFPTELGGKGLSHRHIALAGEELSTVCAPAAFTMGFNHGALRPIMVAGTPEQRESLVGDLLRRKAYASICLTEPDCSGSNLLSLRTRAERKGDQWHVSGVKCMVGNGTEADLHLVLADAVVDGRRRGLTFFAVPRGPGVEVGPNTDKLGFRCVTTPTVEFRDAVVADSHRIGAIGEAELTLLSTLSMIRFGGTVVILGIAVGALRDALPWVESRTVYPGEPLAVKSNVQMDLADIYAEIQSVRMLLWRCADMLDAGQPCSIETSMAKLRASELAVSATNTVVQLMGWRGIDSESPIQKRLRDARATTIYEGTSQVQLLNIFREVRRDAQLDAWF